MSGPGATPALVAFESRSLTALLPGSRARLQADRACLLSTPPLICILLLLAACAPLEQRPPEVRTVTNTVLVPQPVPCFKEEDRPARPKPTPIDIDNATLDQLAAALAADEEANELYGRAVDALFLACSKGGTK